MNRVSPADIPTTIASCMFAIVSTDRQVVSVFSSSIVLVLTEIFLKYTGIYMSVAIAYFILPIVISILFYIYLLKKMTTR